MLSLAVVESCLLRTKHCISHLLVDFRSYTHFSEFISTDWLSFQSLWSLCRCLLCHRVVQVSILIPWFLWVFICHMLLFKESFSLSWPFLSYLVFECWPFLIQLLVHAHLALLISSKLSSVVVYLVSLHYYIWLKNPTNVFHEKLKNVVFHGKRV